MLFVVCHGRATCLSNFIFELSQSRTTNWICLKNKSEIRVAKAQQITAFFHLSWHDPLQAEGQEVASVVSAQEIRVVAELLQISPEGLQKAITYKVTVRTKLLILLIPKMMMMMMKSLLNTFTKNTKMASMLSQNPWDCLSNQMLTEVWSWDWKKKTLKFSSYVLRLVRITVADIVPLYCYPTLFSPLFRKQWGTRSSHLWLWKVLLMPGERQECKKLD